MTSSTGKQLEISKWWHSWWVSKVDLQNFHVTFAIGIVETQLHITIDEYGQNELNILLGKSNIKWNPLIDPQQNINAYAEHKTGPFQTFC